MAGTSRGSAPTASRQSRTISRVLDALRERGARPCGTEVVVLGSSVGWVAFGLSLLLPKASQTIGLEIFGTRVYAANVAASILNGVREVCFVLGDVVEQAEAQCRDAALIWDSLGYGAENGGRTEGLAGATRGCKAGLRSGHVRCAAAGSPLSRLEAVRCCSIAELVDRAGSATICTCCRAVTGRL